MIKNILKIILVLLFSFVFCIGYVSASDINLDLPDPEENIVSENMDSSIDNSNLDNENTEDIENTYSEEDIYQNIFPEELQPSTISTAENSLNTSSIINIILIAVGVVLILLAIAIIIRLKN